MSHRIVFAVALLGGLALTVAGAIAEEPGARGGRVNNLKVLSDKVDDMRAAVAGWYAAHPGYRGQAAKLSELMRGDGWTGWKTRGPALLAACPYYRLGFFPAGTHGWSDTMAEYARTPSEVYEYGY